MLKASSLWQTDESSLGYRRVRVQYKDGHQTGRRVPHIPSRDAESSGYLVQGFSQRSPPGSADSPASDLQ